METLQNNTRTISGPKLLAAIQQFSKKKKKRRKELYNNHDTFHSHIYNSNKTASATNVFPFLSDVLI